jgi:hypothetical protein
MKEGNLKVLKNTIKELEKYKKVLLLTCSNRGEEVSKTQLPKSSILARVIHNNLDNSTIIDVTKLKIYPCEGNVSRMDGNVCGIKEALLDDPEKNPSGYHRCWASVHNPDDELWKISKELFESDCVVFFASVRWGAANMFYQKFRIFYFHKYLYNHYIFYLLLFFTQIFNCSVMRFIKTTCFVFTT